MTGRTRSLGIFERFVALLHRALPEGGSLPEEIWQWRHRGIVILLWLHAAAIVGFALIRGNGLLHSLVEGGIVATAAALAGLRHRNRKFRAGIASLGLLSSSAILVHLSGGYIEFHFHFFVMIGVMALYEDWVPFLMAVAYVVVHHGTVGVLVPSAVYNHPDAWAHPWKWAAIHGAFVTGASIVSLIAWRLNESARARANLILTSAGEGIFGLDLQGRTTFVNLAAARMVGYEPQDLIERPMHAILHHTRPDGTPYPPKECQIYAAAHDGAVRHVTDEVFWKRDGTSFPVEYVSSPVRERGRLVGTVVTFKDITERRRAEDEIRRLNSQLEQRVLERTAQLAEQGQELRSAKTFLENIIAANPVIMLQGDPGDPLRAAYVSPNVEWVLGYTPVEVLSTPYFWIERVHPEDRPALVDGLQRAVKGRAPQVELEYRFLHKNGEYRWLRGIRHYKYDDQGNLVESLGFPTDVTEAKAAEETVRRAKEDAERASRAKSEFLSRVSHELRTPLNAILGFAQLLEIDARTPKERESVEHILKGGQHLLHLINGLLDITRIEVGRLAFSLEPVPLAEVMRESLDLIAPMAAARNIQLKSTVAEAAERHVQADRQRLKQVLLHLLSNAVKYNREGGTVVLSCEQPRDGRLRIQVSDTGPGVPPEKLKGLFTPFERLGVERTGVDGMGVGLALCNGLVDLMGGRVGVESAVGQGSTFWVDLVVAKGQVEKYGRTRKEIPAPAGAAGPPRTVLYIEDNLSNLELIQHILSERPGIKLLVAMQGRLGLDLAHRHQPDLILLDLHLPDIPGEDILRQVRENAQLRHTSVIVISADATPGQIARLRAAGADDYLTKPLDVRKLLALLDKTLTERVRTGP